MVDAIERHQVRRSLRTRDDRPSRAEPQAPDVGEFARNKGDKEENERVLFLEKQHITADTKQIKVVVNEEPYEVGIDPYNKLIDRNSDDNLMAVGVT